MHVPMHYWSDATLIACYLINCTPSSVSNKQITHEVLFPKNPCSMSLLRYLVALALCTTLVRKRTSWIFFPSNAYIWGLLNSGYKSYLHYANACVSPNYLFLNLFCHF